MTKEQFAHGWNHGIDALHAKYIPVTRRALIQRINRALAKRGRKFHARIRGQSYVTDGTVRVGTVDFWRLDVYARDLGVLRKWERLS